MNLLKKMTLIAGMLPHLYASAETPISDADVDTSTSVSTPLNQRRWQNQDNDVRKQFKRIKFLVEQMSLTAGIAGISVLAFYSGKTLILDKDLFLRHEHDMQGMAQLWEKNHFRRTIGYAAAAAVVFVLIDTGTGLAISYHGYKPLYFQNLYSLSEYLRQNTDASGNPTPNPPPPSREALEDLQVLKLHN